MATRSLTEVFILMRNNAVRTRHIYSEQSMSDRVSLVGGDIEMGVDNRRNNESRMPPVWVDCLEEAQYSLTRLKAKISDLDSLHSRLVHRPTLNDSSEEEQQIEALTQEITRMFGATHRLIMQIKQYNNESSWQERKLSTNVISALVSSLQDLSVSFRHSQNVYLKKLSVREQTSREFFATPLDQDFITAGDWELDTDIEHIDRQFSNSIFGNTMTQQQLLLLEEENTQLALRREQEVRQIVTSISDLNDIFKDLAHMVSDQGTVLDRIDYNIEQCQMQVQQGYQQLKKADQYQKKNRKMMCIIVLACVTLVLIVLLIIVKT